MDFLMEKHIALSEYGGEGEIVIGPQTLRSSTRLKNEISRRTVRTCVSNGEVETVGMPIDAGDVEILQVLSYIRKAPFSLDIEAFLNYADALDRVRPGISISLMEDIKARIEELKEEPSPLDS